MPRPYVSTWGEPEEGAQAVMPEGANSVGSPQSPTPPPSAGRPSLIKQRGPKPRRRTHKEMGWGVVQAFADAVHAERERRGWSMRHTAQFLDLHDSQYRDIENARRQPGLRLANKVCHRLGITFDLGGYAE